MMTHAGRQHEATRLRCHQCHLWRDRQSISGDEMDTVFGHELGTGMSDDSHNRCGP
jgi:hypothetical protein